MDWIFSISFFTPDPNLTPQVFSLRLTRVVDPPTMSCFFENKPTFWPAVSVKTFITPAFFPFSRLPCRTEISPRQHIHRRDFIIGSFIGDHRPTPASDSLGHLLVESAFDPIAL